MNYLHLPDSIEKNNSNYTNTEIPPPLSPSLSRDIHPPFISLTNPIHPHTHKTNHEYSFTPFNLSNADLYMIILPTAE